MRHGEQEDLRPSLDQLNAMVNSSVSGQTSDGGRSGNRSNAKSLSLKREKRISQSGKAIPEIGLVLNTLISTRMPSQVRCRQFPASEIRFPSPARRLSGLSTQTRSKSGSRIATLMSMSDAGCVCVVGEASNQPDDVDFRNGFELGEPAGKEGSLFGRL